MIFGDQLPTWAIFAEMAVVGTLVILSGARFSRAADTLSRRLNIGGGWIGLVLLATATSLPELVSSATATGLGNVDLAMGGILGSCCFNVTIIVLLNAVLGKGSILRNVSRLHTLTSSFGLLLVGTVLLWVVLADKFAERPLLAQVLELSWTLIIIMTYLVGMRLIYKFERASHQGQPAAVAAAHGGFALYAELALLGGILVVTAWWLAHIGDILSTHPIEMIGRPLSATFVGALFLALATSLPEIVTSVAAVRLGNIDMALGNILGSNMFNIFCIPFLKVVSLAKGDSLLMAPGVCNTTQNLITGLLAIILTAIAVSGLTYQSSKRASPTAGARRHFGFDSILIALAYTGGMILLLMEP